jgi:hypothetical protein
LRVAKHATRFIDKLETATRLVADVHWRSWKLPALLRPFRPDGTVKFLFHVIMRATFILSVDEENAAFAAVVALPNAKDNACSQAIHYG